jgi:indole-3-glycerol phosphate synthase
MILDDILARTRADLEARKRARPIDALEAAAASRPAPRPLAKALRRPGEIACIAEFKRRSPSAGWIREHAEVSGTARAYAAGGASALSVLTDGPFFGGRLEDLAAASSASGLPILRKDFIVDPYQLYEARLAGADAALLIVAALTPSDLRALRELARELGLDVLVEVHDAGELRVALDAGAELIGINNRDLRDFSVDVERTFALLDAIPEGVTVVSESGIGDSRQLARLQAAGVAAVLVGESLMRAPAPERALRALRSHAGAASGVE